MTMHKQISPARKLPLALKLALGMTAASWLPQAIAQGLMLEEVVVTAQKRAESLQDVPIAVTAISGEKIDSAGIRGLVDLSSYIPNVSINTQSGASPGNIIIRGVGSGNNVAFEQSVGMFVDGVYAGRARQYLVPFLDVGSVEVLKGPQGTLFGKNTVAGAISIKSERPTDSLEGSLRAQYEVEYGTTEYVGVVSGPVTDKLSARLAGKYRDEEGYTDNIIRGGDEPEAENSAIRGSFVYAAADTVELSGKLEYAKQEATGSKFQVSGIDGAGFGVKFADVIDPREKGDLDDKTTSDSFNGEYNDTDTVNSVFNIVWDMDELTLTSITGYSEYDTDYISDGDFSNLKFIQSTADEDFDQVSQEFRIASPGGETVDYIAGLYLESQDLNNSTRNDLDAGSIGLPLPPVGALSEFDQDGESVAVFGQATWHFAQAWSVTGGIRWAYEEKDAKLQSFTTDFGSNNQNTALEPISRAINGRETFVLENTRDTDNWSPTVSMQWDYSDEGMAYLRASRGYKSGGFNASLVDGDPSQFEFDDEKVDGIELGSKMNLLDGAATLNLAVFYNEFSDRQVASFTDTGFVVGNAAKSISKGVEADGRWMATEHLTFGLSLAYLDSEYDDFDNASCAGEQLRADNPVAGCDLATKTQDLSDEKTSYAPEWSGAFITNFFYPIGDSMELRADLDVIYTDDFYVTQSLDSNLEEDSYVKVNARIGLASAADTWEIALIGKNLTDKTTSDYGAGIPLFTGSYFNSVAAPRTIAIEATYRFF
jgi:iron complex outermembrane receptor protein